MRRCRLQAGLSQVVLARKSGVSQSTISRLERGKASSAAMFKLVRIGDALGYRFPLAFCPHDHLCEWERLDEDGVPSGARRPVGSANYFQRFIAGGNLIDEHDAEPDQGGPDTTPEHDAPDAVPDQGGLDAEPERRHAEPDEDGLDAEPEALRSTRQPEPAPDGMPRRAWDMPIVARDSGR